MKKILPDRSFKIALIISILFLGTGFAFLHLEMIAYGWAFFYLTSHCFRNFNWRITK